MKKGPIRRTLEGVAIGWAVSALLITSPVEAYDVVAILVLLVVISILDFADMR